MATTRTIELRTAIPGPRSKAILERKDRVIADPLSIYLPVVVAEGRGATLTDVDGNTFIDFTGGVGCLNVGHSHPKVVEAAQEQLTHFAHTDFTIVPYEVYVTLAERLIAVSPFTGPAKAAFFNAGTEAVENAIKFARSLHQAPRRHRLRGRLPRPHASLDDDDLEDAPVQGRARAVRARGVPGSVRAGLPRPGHAHRARGARARTVTQVAAEQVAAIVIEPVQGEGGFVVAPRDFMAGIRRICDEHGIVMVVDEVQTGYGRTGKMFAIEHYGIEPDLMTVAKSIAGGLPLSAVLGKAEIMDSPPDSAIGGTYVGNPVAQAAALAVLDVFEEENLVERAQQIGERIRERMVSWQERIEQIGDVRGLGAMLAVEFVRDRDSKEPNPELATAVVEAAAERGLLLLKSGIYSNCIRVLCPLVLTDAELDEALEVWEDALGRCRRRVACEPP